MSQGGLNSIGLPHCLYRPEKRLCPAGLVERLVRYNLTTPQNLSMLTYDKSSGSGPDLPKLDGLEEWT